MLAKNTTRPLTFLSGPAGVALRIFARDGREILKGGAAPFKAPGRAKSKCLTVGNTFPTVRPCFEQPLTQGLAAVYNRRERK